MKTKFNSVRFTYLRSDNKHPHTCIAVKVNVDGDKASILYSIARRESPGRIMYLKRNMQKIRELGGIVPETMLRQLLLSRKDFSKKRARMIACNRLNSDFAYVAAEGIDVAVLNAHTIMELVLKSIVSRVPSVEYQMLGEVSLPTTTPGVAEYVRESATCWLNGNMPSNGSLKKKLYSWSEIKNARGM